MARSFLFVVLLFLLMEGGRCSVEEESNCIRDVDPEQGKAWVQHRWSGRVKEYIRPILVQGPHYLLQSTLLVAVRFSFINDTVPYHPVIPSYDNFNSVSVSVYDDLSDNSELPNNTVPCEYIASASRYLVSLGTSVWDVLTVGSAAATYRTNLTTIVLLCSPCPGQQDRVLSRVFQMVMMASDIDKDALTLTPLPGISAVTSSQVGLFMPVALLSLFLSLLLLPCLYSSLLHRSLTQRFTKQTLQSAKLSLLSTASLVAGFSIGYWIISALSYYCHLPESVDGVLFTSMFFSPMTQCMIFYMLAGLAGFLGGMLFSQWTTTSATSTCCQVLGKGLLTACTTAIFFHSFFLILALFEYPIAVLTNVVEFIAVVVLLFLALCAILEQFRKSRFHGNFSLVALMQMTHVSIYCIVVVSFQDILDGDEPGFASGAFLCVITFISLASIMLAAAMIVIMANRGGMKKHTHKIEKDPETAAQGCSAPVGGGEMQVTRRLQRSVDIASVASEMGFVVLIPDVVQSWEKMKANNDKT